VERRECFGSITEVILPDGLTRIQTKAECRDCQEFRDCLRQSRQSPEERKKREDKDELKKQEMITQIIDLSQILSNEIGSCLLELLSRIYNSNLGTVLSKNLLLFYEVPKDTPSLSLTIPISAATLGLINREESEGDQPLEKVELHPQGTQPGGFHLYLILIQRSFSNNRKANMGLIAYEVARLFSSDGRVVQQILQTLTDSESAQFKKMDIENRMDWLMGKWGFSEELRALKKEMAFFKGKRAS